MPKKVSKKVKSKIQSNSQPASNEGVLPNKPKAIAIVYRSGKPEAVNLAKKITKWLDSKEISVLTAPEQKVLPGTKLIKGKVDWKKVGLILVLGGDGTYLRGVRLQKEMSIPLLGINMGNLGFLTSNQSAEALSLLEKFMQGELEIQKRSMLFAKVKRSNKLRGEYHALNDVVIERGSFSQLINSNIYHEKQLVSEVKADGFIIASPSGSTAYNLSAGGPIVHPEAEVLVVTVVAPHSLTTRPIIFPDKKNVSIQINGNGIKAHLIIDGQTVDEISHQDEVTICRSKVDHLVVVSPKYNFFHLLREKLRFGDR